MKLWAKRDEQINRVLQSTGGMYDDLQEFAGKSIQGIEALELPDSAEPPSLLMASPGELES